VSLEVRRQVEEALKEGRLRGVVATASLEMGIDMGAVDLVCQVQSPGNVARGLQRVGRAGHLVGAGSKGRFIPKNSADLLEQAVLTREMFAGRVETLRVPANCLDVLAQQLVAMIATDDWHVPDLLALVRQAYPYRDLSAHAFEATLEMTSGRYRFGDTQARHQALQARVSWDRVHNRLVALPGSKHLALRHGGVIPDTGQYAVYRSGGDVRLGELDEEFVYERRPGDVFLLGTTPWRLERIDADRVFVTPAEGEPAMLPFWRGEGVGRSPDLGEAYGRFLDELVQKLESDGDPNVLAWLRSEAHLDENAARSLLHYVQRQHLVSCVPTNRRILVEASRDQLGDWQVILLSPFGARAHLGLRLALEAVLTRRLGCRPQILHHDDGVIVRLPDRDEPILDLLDGLTPENVEDLLLAELANSPLFALRFRQNAARALLMPAGSPDRRAPLWLQRLRGRDLLQIVRSHADFPVVVETFRECLHDHLDIDRLRNLLDDVRTGRVEVVSRRAEVPSPFAGNLLFSFTAAFLYQFDRVEQNSAQTSIDRDLLDQMLAPRPGEYLLDPRGIQRVETRLRGVGRPPRTPAETAEWLRRLGDVAPEELEGPTAGFLEQLRVEGRAVLFDMPAGPSPRRWILTEEEGLYRGAFSSTPSDGMQEAASTILLRFLNTHALVSLADVLQRYPFEPAWAQRQLEAWAGSGRLIPVQSAAGSLPAPSWSAPENLREIQTASLAILRREVIACEPSQFVDFVLRWQRVHPETRAGGPDGLDAVLDRLEGLALPAELWDQFVLPARVPEYQPRWLADWLASGQGLWVLQGEGGEQLAFLRRESVRRLRPPAPASASPVANSNEVARVEEALRARGASFLTDLALDLNMPPSTVRSALQVLACRGVATNDQLSAATFQQASRSPRRTAPEGRWSLTPWGAPETEALAVIQASMLLDRYGVVGRELALMDPWLLPWRVLYEVLSRRELAGEVRRGYFVEGLAGAQFALPAAVDLLQGLHLPSTANAPVILLHSLDPANLYGAGAPLDVALLDGGTRPFLRRAGNWLVVRAGRPILLIEQHGKRLTALPSASADEVREAVACLPQLLRRRGGSPLPKLTVEEWNGEPVVSTPGHDMLQSAGFIRELQTMTLYAGFATTAGT
jgi:ATP-dependent Lhr-like helicase